MPDWSTLKARISNRLARHMHIAPLRLPGTSPMVSFTFDDVPESAATVGAPTPSFYGCSPSLLRHALEAASRRKIPILNIAEALRHAGG